MKSQEAIQRAHDILLGMLLDEVPIGMSDSTRQSLHAAADVLCWVLGHEHNQAFSSNLDQIMHIAITHGYLFKRREADHD